ncbi:unnamed protein product [Rotaria magnacalcarata]|uniref:Uncharacterized protein n=2 Tax=Rotaria magnacalcarata TaxID=392030 RepID=A0A815GND8_9BILA|nr:unnamed protein product [Rotaria magnacalcarata]CAF1400889.1 unnamed protein product [Rotaria magnacalcarata]CAF2038662.1 unnamed protein product [Rotaria magnacalcarata]CAF3846356.1 unnamed protein product [Rotaria magnacalcarata]CAF5188231.1 unnamed protein product [Rotaria magnacalcarata]
MTDISLVRYLHLNPIAAPICRPKDISPSEMYYRPLPTQQIVDIIRYNFRRYLDRFANKDLFKTSVRRISEQIVIQRLKIPEGLPFRIFDI